MSFTPELRQRISANLAMLEPRILDAAGLRHAAVGVVLLPDLRGRTCFVLTRRLSTLRRHSGQWALPGGRLEAGETAAIAALREIQEEVGLDLPANAILGRLPVRSECPGWPRRAALLRLVVSRRHELESIAWS